MDFVGEYADGLKARLRAAVPDAIIEERFLGPTELADIFSATALNIHPCLYDAYGMTVVEAASQGVSCSVLLGRLLTIESHHFECMILPQVST